MQWQIKLSQDLLAGASYGVGQGGPRILN